MKIEIIKTDKKQIGASKYGPYFNIEDVILLYDKKLINKKEARYMLSCITKIVLPAIMENFR